MRNEADTPGFKIMNVVYALLWCVAIFFVLPDSAPIEILLIPFFWFIHARAQRGRLEDLRDNLDFNNELLIELLRRDPNFNLEQFIENYEDEKYP